LASIAGRKRILITGAAGRVGSALARAWENDYSLTLLDQVQPPAVHGARILLVDVNDIDAVRASLEGIQAVVHLAVSGTAAQHTWDTLVPTAFTGTWSVLQAASEAGCERVIFASSVLVPLDPKAPYSASKRWGEMLAARYAELTGISTICLRIGPVAQYGDPALRLGHGRTDRVLTFGDMVRLFTCAVEAPAHIRHGVYCGISYTRNPRLSIASTRRELGFEPQDNPYALAWRFLLSPAGVVDLLWRGLRRARRIILRRTNSADRRGESLD
jgi:NAD(P)-dependent dehydrogenase (short-subunit alcohol dehydrogenase family)